MTQAVHPGAAVAELEVRPQEVLVPSLMGFGGQFNQNVFVPIPKEPGKIAGAQPASFADLEQKVVELALQFVRVFFEPTQSPPPPAPSGTLDSLVQTVKLARKVGATIVVTLAGGDLPPAVPPPTATPEPAAWQAGLSWFADVLERLATPQPTTSLWVTIQNEPNTPTLQKRITVENVKDAYRYLDTLLIGKGLRSKEPGSEQRIRFMGGDLVEGDTDPRSPSNQAAWLEYMAANMADLFDAYSVHIYWDYWQTSRFIERLAGVQTILKSLPSGQKPVLVTEHGVRGRFPWPPRSDKDKDAASLAALMEPAPISGFFLPATEADTTIETGEALRTPWLPIEQTNVAAFQTAWFQIQAARTGFVGMAKWDCYWGMYDLDQQAYFAIGPPVETGGDWAWPLYPMYYLLWLFSHTTEVGWRVVDVAPPNQVSTVTDDPHAPSPQLAAFAGHDESMTIIGLDSRGSTINEASGTTVLYRITGLPADTFNLIVWNENGDGKLTMGKVDVAGGVASFAAPLQAVFALTTNELERLPS